MVCTRSRGVLVRPPFRHKVLRPQKRLFDCCGETTVYRGFCFLNLDLLRPQERQQASRPCGVVADQVAAFPFDVRVWGGEAHGFRPHLVGPDRAGLALRISGWGSPPQPDKSWNTALVSQVLAQMELLKSCRLPPRNLFLVGLARLIFHNIILYHSNLCYQSRLVSLMGILVSLEKQFPSREKQLSSRETRILLPDKRFSSRETRLLSLETRFPSRETQLSLREKRFASGDECRLARMWIWAVEGTAFHETFWPKLYCTFSGWGVFTLFQVLFGQDWLH